MTLRDLLEEVYNMFENEKESVLQRKINPQKLREAKQFYEGANAALKEVLIRLIRYKIENLEIKGETGENFRSKKINRDV